MRKLFTKIASLGFGLALAIGVGVSLNQKPTGKANADDMVTAFNFTPGNVPSGYTFVNVNSADKTTYYQDKNSSTGLDIGVKKSSGTIWTTAPKTISLTVKVGGGSAKDPLANNLEAYLIDSNQTKLGNSVTVTTKVEAKEGKDYTVTVPSQANVAGVMIHHDKESSYNIRVYGISLAYEGGQQIPLTDIGLKSTEEVIVGKTVTLEPIFTPTNASTLKTLSWESSDDSIATVDDNGVVTGVKEGKATITVHATDIDKSASCEVTVKPIPPVPVTHTIEDCYKVAKGTSVKFNGMYMGAYGTNPYNGIFFADGEWGIMVYKTASVPSEWEVGKTVVAISGKTDNYNGLVQIIDASFEATASTVDTPVVYPLTGSETSPYVLSRKTSLSGTITDISVSPIVKDKDCKITVDLGNEKVAMIFIKKNSFTDDQIKAFNDAFQIDSYVAVTGFLNYYKSGQTIDTEYDPSCFQVIVPEIASTEKYTASKFATDFLSATDPICASGSYDNLTALQAIWSDVAAKYSLLDAEQKAAFVSSEAEATIKNALARYDYIIGKYNTATVKNLAEFVEGHVVTYSNVDFAVPGIEQNNSIVVIISCISATSILLLALLIIKRRKANVK